MTLCSDKNKTLDIGKKSNQIESQQCLSAQHKIIPIASMLTLLVRLPWSNVIARKIHI